MVPHRHRFLAPVLLLAFAPSACDDESVDDTEFRSGGHHGGGHHGGGHHGGGHHGGGHHGGGHHGGGHHGGGHHGGGHHGGGHHGQLGNIEARAAFSCDFELDPTFPMELVGPSIARDRMYMAGMEGLVHGKHLPLSIDFQTGQFFSGGRYLFDTKSNATDYREFVTEDYVLDGFQFLERPGVLDPSCFQWKNIAAYEFGDIGTDHVVMRTERWSIPGHGNKTHFLRSLAEDLSEDAEGRGLTGVWLLYSRQERFVEIVHVGGRVGPIEPGELDVASIGALATAPTLGEEFDERGWDKVLDRTHFVLSIWFPFELGDQGEAAVWPNSPPLPEPYCGDALCVPSRGEDAVTCPQDCTINCGDAVCQPGEGEDTANCPGDCRI